MANANEILQTGQVTFEEACKLVVKQQYDELQGLREIHREFGECQKELLQMSGYCRDLSETTDKVRAIHAAYEAKFQALREQMADEIKALNTDSSLMWSNAIRANNFSLLAL